MNHTLTEEDNITRIEIQGDMIGGPDAKELHDVIHDLINKKKYKLILDLSQVKLMNSSGLGILISGLTTAKRAGGDVILLNLTERIKNLLAITKLDSVFESYDSYEQAKSQFA